MRWVTGGGGCMGFGEGTETVEGRVGTGGGGIVEEEEPGWWIPANVPTASAMMASAMTASAIGAITSSSSWIFSRILSSAVV